MQRALPKTQFKILALTFHFRPFLRNCGGGGGWGWGGIVPDVWLKRARARDAGVLGMGQYKAVDEEWRGF